MSSEEENIASLADITGLKREQASTLLTAYNGNLEGAINAFFENPEGILNPEPAVVIDDDDEEEVRAPIPRKTEILLPQVDINRGRLKRRGATITEVPFRNFELEGRLQEQMLMEGQGPSSKRVTRLEALFMPPFEIIFSGSFDMAQNFGKSVDKWILVNLQDDLNFSCQTLNRDLWSDSKLKDFLRNHLIFWQISNKTTDGAKFKTFYKVNSEPYIGMIDPRTGEEVERFSISDIEPTKFLSTLKAFLLEKKSPNGKEVSVKELSLMRPSTAQLPSSSSANGSKASTSKKPVWFTEDAEEDEFQEVSDSESELEPDTPTSKSPSKHATIPTETPSSPVFSSDDETSLPPAEKTRIMLKMPGDVTERLFFRSSRTLDHTKAKLLGKFVARFADHKGKPIRFLCPAIKTDLSTLDGSRSLLDLKIHPNAVIHVTVDD
ncbi:UBX domain-containing protein 7 [Toxorhynchites rutilus septentrionalis]|uniref:UBX domain-containing protein 7 n=1 Tax=Toxorhynchites rutilus septentrionalis TaxID=329112 RepID=UPI002478FE7C|nr:UBX domain-containing protein 7 [Toxorhynchites rutilus septentrionalis]